MYNTSLGFRSITHFKTVSEHLSTDRETRALTKLAKQEREWSKLRCSAVKRSEEYRAKVELAELLEQASNYAGEYVWYHSLRGDSRRAMNLRDTGLSFLVDIHALNKRGISLRRSPGLAEASRLSTESKVDPYLLDRHALLNKALTQVMPGVLSITDELLVQGRNIII
jgi:hypothetical protein